MGKKIHFYFIFDNAVPTVTVTLSFGSSRFGRRVTWQQWAAVISHFELRIEAPHWPQARCAH